MNKEDCLSRQPYIDLLKSIIKNQSQNPNGYSFAIDGEWGSGKTWILSELENQLLQEKDNKYLIFHYNAWENDFYEEPLVALLSVMIGTLKIHKKTIKESGSVGRAISTSIKTLTKVAGSVIEKKYSINPSDIIESFKESGKSIADIKLTKSDFNTMLPLEGTLKKIKEAIKKLSEEKSIILIVDEIDRCLPEYSIKVLERLHHICNQIPVIQILAINRKALCDSILNVFGKTYTQDEKKLGIDETFTESYLQKFIDNIIPLSTGRIDKRLDVLNGLEKKYKTYIRPDNMERDFIILNEDFLGDFISSIMDGVPRRTQEKVFKQVALCHELTINSGIAYEEDNITYAYLIYEILSCIRKFLFHEPRQYSIQETQDQKIIRLCVTARDGLTRNTYNELFKKINSNIASFFQIQINTDMSGMPFDNVFIRDTKSYLMAFFVEKPDFPYVNFEYYVWNWISKDKIFLQKYDEIMDMLVT